MMRKRFRCAGSTIIVLAAVAGVLQSAQAAEVVESWVEAQFRGCDSGGWCVFGLESHEPAGQSLHRVRPDGVTFVAQRTDRDVAIRDRLNALLSNMIHQAKRIELLDLRALPDGGFAATVTVNGLNVAADPMLQDLAMDAEKRSR